MSKVFDIAFKLGAELTSSFKSTFDNASSMMKTLGGAAAALGGAAALTGAISQVADMSQELASLSAQTGIIGGDFEELKGTAENLFRNNYGDSFSEVTDALANVKQNMHELNDVDLEQFTGQALSFSKTFDADINEVTRAANNMMSSFGVSASTAMDLFATGAQRGLNFSDEMLDNVAEYGPLFGEMGYSAEEYFGILERGAQAGVYNLDYVNDVMKEFQIRAKDGSKGTSEAMGELSKETQKVWKDFLAGKGTIKDVASQVVGELKGMDDQVAANQIGVGLFGTKWEDLEATAMYAMLGSTEAMQGFEGSMETVNQIQFSSFNAAIQGIGRILFMDLVYPLGDAVLPYLNKFANFLSSNLPGAIDKAKSLIQTFGPAVLGIIGAFTAYKGAMAVISTAQKTFNIIQKASITLMTAYRTAMLAFTFAGGGVKGIISGLRSAMAALNLTMLANPFVLALAGIAALVAGFVLLYNKSETFRAAVAPLLEMLKTQFVAMGQQVMGVFAQLAPVIMSAISSIIPVITQLAVSVLPLILSAAQMIFPILLSIIQSVLPVAVTLFQMIISVVLDLAQNLFPLILTVVQMVFPLVLSIIQMAAPIITNILQFLATILSGVVIPAIQGILTVVQFVFPYVQLIIQNALTIVNGIIQTAMALLRGDWDGAWNAIKGTAETIMNNIIGFFQGINLFEVGKSIITGLINGIKSMGSAVLGAIADMVPAPIRSAASGVMDALGLGGYADGGIVTSPELAWIGEGGDTESVIPWNNSQRSKDLWLQTGQALGMLNKEGMFSVQQQQVTPEASVIKPQQVMASNGGGGIVLQYSPQYTVERPGDLDQVKQHAETDKNDLLSRLAEIQRNERRLSFG